VLNIQLNIDGKLADMAMPAQGIGPRYPRFAYGGENRLGAQPHVVRPLTASTSNAAPIRRWFSELQQLGERRRSRLVHGRAKGCLHRFQIGALTAVPLGKDAFQQHGYFPRNLRLDRLGRFFSSAVSVSSTGRNAHIFSLTSMICPQSS
jgi:hypothetical protein